MLSKKEAKLLADIFNDSKYANKIEDFTNRIEKAANSGIYSIQTCVVNANTDEEYAERRVLYRFFVENLGFELTYRDIDTKNCYLTISWN